MKFKIGDKVMLKAVPYDDFISDRYAEKFYKENIKTVFVFRSIFKDQATLIGKQLAHIRTKYLKHAVKPKPIKYTIDCRGMRCDKCPQNINGDVKICEFTGTKSQVEAHIKNTGSNQK